MGGKRPELVGVTGVKELESQRLYGLIDKMNDKLDAVAESSTTVKSKLETINDSIDGRLSNIEDELKDVRSSVRNLATLEAQVSANEKRIDNQQDQLNVHHNRIHNVELKHAEGNGSNSALENTVRSIENQIQKLALKVNELEGAKDQSKGQKQVGVGVLKWVGGVLAGFILFAITSEFKK